MSYAKKLLAAFALIGSLAPATLQANPYLAKPGETPAPIRVATCAVSGGFIHLHTALDNRLFDKYGLRPEFLLVRGAGVSVAALGQRAPVVQSPEQPGRSAQPDDGQQGPRLDDVEDPRQPAAGVVQRRETWE